MHLNLKFSYFIAAITVIMITQFYCSSPNGKFASYDQPKGSRVLAEDSVWSCNDCECVRLKLEVYKAHTRHMDYGGYSGYSGYYSVYHGYHGYDGYHDYYGYGGYYGYPGYSGYFGYDTYNGYDGYIGYTGYGGYGGAGTSRFNQHNHRDRYRKAIDQKNQELGCSLNWKGTVN